MLNDTERDKVVEHAKKHGLEHVTMSERPEYGVRRDRPPKVHTGETAIAHIERHRKLIAHRGQ